MSLDGNALKLARARLKKQTVQREENALRLEKEIRAQSPEIDELLRNIAASAPRAINAAVSGDTKEIAAAEHDNLMLQAKLSNMLAMLGYKSDALDRAPSCPSCADTGYIGGTMCKCLRKLYDEEVRRSLSGLYNLAPSRFTDFKLEYYTDPADRKQMENVLDLAKAYAKTFGLSSMSLLFTGPPGLGKTMLAGCIARRVSQREYSVVYDTMPSIMSKFESAKFGHGDDEDTAASIKRYKESSLLIADDLGTEMLTSFTSMALYDLINSRLISGNKTIITTNLSIPEIYSRYAPAIASRVVGEYHVVEFTGGDIRLIKKSLE